MPLPCTPPPLISSTCPYLAPPLQLYPHTHALTITPLLLQVGAIRAQSSLLAHKMGPVTCMAFHPYQLLLGAGGGDSICTVYVIDNSK